MLIAQAARHLGLTIPTVSHLKRLGWLTVDRKQTALRIMPALRRSEVEAFGASFVCAAELARLPSTKTRPASVHAHLRSAGLLPEVPGSRKLQPFYDRDIAERVIRDIYRIEPSLPGAKI
jgi:DNA-binding transcriptional ArsR family regulator